MRHQSTSFLVFLAVNVGVAYLPGLLWVPSVPGTASLAWKFAFSPIMLVLLVLWATDPMVAWGALSGFLLILAVISAAMHRSTWAWVLPGVVFLASLLQGLYAAAVIHGINAIGGS